MKKEFSCVVSCMDGRIQTAIQDYMTKRYNKLYVDTITLAGPSKVIADKKHMTILDNIKYRTDISVHQHGSQVLAVVGHFDCAAIKTTDAEQKQFVKDAVVELGAWYPNLEVVGLWVGPDLFVTEIAKTP